MSILEMALGPIMGINHTIVEGREKTWVSRTMVEGGCKFFCTYISLKISDTVSCSVNCFDRPDNDWVDYKRPLRTSGEPCIECLATIGETLRDDLEVRGGH